MSLGLLDVVFLRLLNLLWLLGRSSTSEDVEFLVLRHAVAVLRKPTRHRAWPRRIERHSPRWSGALPTMLPGASRGHVGHDPALASSPGHQELGISPSHRAMTRQLRRWHR